MYKVIVAGSRTILNEQFVYEWLDLLINPNSTKIVSGGAKGPDSLALRYAKDNKIEWALLLADWDKYKNSAGIMRNKEMGDYADALIAFWDGKSRGTKHMIDYMVHLKKPVTVIYCYE